MTDLNTTGADAPKELDPLDKIALEASFDEQATQRAQDEALNPPPPEGVPAPAEIWALIPKQLGKLLSMALPELADVYNDEACSEWGKGMAAVSEKYGWDANETMLKWAPEVALATATIPLAVPTYFVVKKRLDVVREQREKADRMRPPEQPPMKDINKGPMGQEPGGFVDPT
jgi:hypothetical protein